jgi:nucleotide-binding universal stress UspA family protein
MTEAQASYRIVVGVDLSETGDHAIRHAVQLAKQLPGSELHVTYVITPAARGLDQISSELRSKIDQLREHVTAVCAPASVSDKFHIETVFHVRIGEPAAAIHQVAVDVDGDMIVVGTHGRKGVEKPHVACAGAGGPPQKPGRPVQVRSPRARSTRSPSHPHGGRAPAAPGVRPAQPAHQRPALISRARVAPRSSSSAARPCPRSAGARRSRCPRPLASRS